MTWAGMCALKVPPNTEREGAIKAINGHQWQPTSSSAASARSSIRLAIFSTKGVTAQREGAQAILFQRVAERVQAECEFGRPLHQRATGACTPRH